MQKIRSSWTSSPYPYLQYIQYTKLCKHLFDCQLNVTLLHHLIGIFGLNEVHSSLVKSWYCSVNSTGKGGWIAILYSKATLRWKKVKKNMNRSRIYFYRTWCVEWGFKQAMYCTHFTKKYNIKTKLCTHLLNYQVNVTSSFTWYSLAIWFACTHQVLSQLGILALLYIKTNLSMDTV